MKHYMDQVTDDYETMIVTRKNNKKCCHPVRRNLQQSHGKCVRNGKQGKL